MNRNRTPLRTGIYAASSIAWALAALPAAAAPPASSGPTKDQCIDAHSRGQDLREQKRFVRAKEQFLLCNQSSCPGPIQADCVRFMEQVDSVIPTVSFGARDDEKRDLPDTQVYFDGSPVASRLDDAKLVEADPGPHAVRFVHAGREVNMRVVLTPGDKGRALIGLFTSPAAAATQRPAPTPAYEPRSARSAWPLVLAGVGAAGFVAGSAMFVVGIGRVPTECSVSNHTCASAPGDDSFDRAHSAVSMSNAGLAVGLTGAVAAIAGLTWYFALPTSTGGGEGRPPTVALSPWFDRSGGGGMTIRGAL